MYYGIISELRGLKLSHLHLNLAHNLVFHDVMYIISTRRPPEGEIKIEYKYYLGT